MQANIAYWDGRYDEVAELMETARPDAEAQPRPTYIAGARFVLAHAHLGKGELDAVGEHLAPIPHATGVDYRTAAR